MGKRRGAGKNRGKGRRVMTVTEDQSAASVGEVAAAAAGQPPPKKKRVAAHSDVPACAPAVAAAAAPTQADSAAAAAAAPFFERAPRFAVKTVQTHDPASLEELRKPVKQTLDPDQHGPSLTAGEILAYLNNTANSDSGVLAQQLMAWLIHPVSIEKFVGKCWERRCLLLRRGASAPKYYSGLFSLRELRGILTQSPLQYGKDLDITQYSIDSGRKTLNASGVAVPDTAWRAFDKSGFSLRFTRPHVHHRGLWQLLAQLEEFFGCGVCGNAYATPAAADSATPRQGFAAQFSEVEVFVLQVEGTAHWQLYAPSSVDALHPRRASPDLHQKSLGEPFLDVTLQAGDLLYVPSGVIFQTRNVSTSDPGLELRLSTGAGMTYRDLVAAALPRALDIASEEEAMLRRKLPRDFLSYMGVSFSGGDVVTAPPLGLPPSLREEYSTKAEGTLKERKAARATFQTQLNTLCEKVLAVLPLDTAADQLAKQQLTDFRLPPAFSAAQLKGCHHGKGVKEELVINEERYLQHPQASLRATESLAACLWRLVPC